MSCVWLSCRFLTSQQQFVVVIIEKSKRQTSRFVFDVGWFLSERSITRLTLTDLEKKIAGSYLIFFFAFVVVFVIILCVHSVRFRFDWIAWPNVHCWRSKFHCCVKLNPMIHVGSTKNIDKKYGESVKNVDKKSGLFVLLFVCCRILSPCWQSLCRKFCCQSKQKSERRHVRTKTLFLSQSSVALFVCVCCWLIFVNRDKNKKGKEEKNVETASAVSSDDKPKEEEEKKEEKKEEEKKPE